MPAQRSPNRLYAEINLTYIIHVYEYLDTVEIPDGNGRKTKINRYKNQQIVSAKTLSKFIHGKTLTTAPDGRSIIHQKDMKRYRDKLLRDGIDYPVQFNNE
nr:hypothetical protein [uncultured Flavobacterium sp.]